MSLIDNFAALGLHLAKHSPKLVVSLHWCDIIAISSIKDKKKFDNKWDQAWHGQIKVQLSEFRLNSLYNF